MLNGHSYVLERIQHWAKRAKKNENKIPEDLLKSGDQERAAAVKKQTVEDAQKCVELIKQSCVRKELTAELLNTLIEKNIVHEAAEDDFGFRQQEIETIFRFVGKID